jgi:hypothetical protein
MKCDDEPPTGLTPWRCERATCGLCYDQPRADKRTRVDRSGEAPHRRTVAQKPAGLESPLALIEYQGHALGLRGEALSEYIQREYAASLMPPVVTKYEFSPGAYAVTSEGIKTFAPDYSQDTPSQVQAYASLMATAAAEAVKARYGERGARAVRDALRGKGDSLAKELEVMEMFRRKVVLALMACLEGLPKLEQFAAREAEAREHLRRMARERGL